MSVRVGLVGAGDWGKNLARNFDQLGALAAIYDRNEERAAALNLPLAPSFEALLSEVSAVAIAVPGEHHYEVAKAALAAGKDVYVEKPLVLKRGQGEELIEEARRRGKILMIGHLLQYHAAFRKLLDMVKGGELGQLRSIVSNRLNYGKVLERENALWSLAPHDISMLLALTGGELPTKVRCTGGSFLTQGIHDTALTTLSFESGVEAQLFVSWLHPFKEQKLIVVGSEAMAVFDDTLPWEKKLQLYTEPLKGQPVVVEQEEPLRAECSHFLHCCKTRETPRTDGEEGVLVLRVLESAQSSLDASGEARNPAVDYEAHATAIVDKEAVVGPGSKIWNYSQVMAGASIGARCNLGQNVVVHPGALLGSNVKVQNNVSIYSGVEIGDDVFIGPSAVFTNIKNPRSAIARRDQYVPTRICTGSTIGANATILCGVELGSHCLVGAGSVVASDVKPHALVVGNPGRQVGWVSRAGHRLDLPLECKERQIAACQETGELYALDGKGELIYLELQEALLTGR